MKITPFLEGIWAFIDQGRAANGLAILGATTPIRENFAAVNGRDISVTSLAREYDPQQPERGSRWQKFLKLWFPISFASLDRGDRYVRQFLRINSWRRSLDIFRRPPAFDELQDANQILDSQLRRARRMGEAALVVELLDQITKNNYEMLLIAEGELRRAPKPVTAAKARPRFAILKSANLGAYQEINFRSHYEH